jgi:hypothetical protein
MAMDDVTRRLRAQLGREPTFEEVRTVAKAEEREYRRVQEQLVLDNVKEQGARAHRFQHQLAARIQQARDAGRYTIMDE